MGIWLAALLLLAVGPAAAAPQWYQQYERGLELASAGDWASALEAFEAAAVVEPRPRESIRTYGREFLLAYDPAFHRARCLLELGRASEAALRLAEAREADVTPAGDLAALAVRIGEALDASPSVPPPPPAPPGTLRIDSSPPGALVLLDGRSLGTTPLSSFELPGTTHRLTVRLDGYEAWEETILPAPGELLHLQVALRLASPTTPSPEAAAQGTAPRVVDGVNRPSRRLSRRPAEDRPEAATRDDSTGRTAPAGISLPVPEPEAEIAPATPASVSRDDTPGTPPDATVTPAGRRRASRWVAIVLAVALVVLVLARPRARGGSASSWRVAGYAVHGELGRGGMATTYRATRLADRREVALKIPHESGDATFQSRFLREGRLGKALHHPRIVRILDAGESEGRLFLAMELLEGHTLAEEIRRHPEGLPLRRALELTHEICEALDYAHAKGVVHRDLKPENIMLQPEGLKVMDFGVARIEGDPGLTTSRFFFGSPLYSAPELVDPRSIDHRADLYSLGVLLFEMLEGEPPFRHESLFRVLEMHQEAPFPHFRRPLPPELERMVRRLCEKEPERRYASAQELLVELKRLLFGPAIEPSEAPVGALDADG